MKGKYLSSVAGVAFAAAVNVGGVARAQDHMWTGGYFGGYAGWAWGTSHATTSVDCTNAPPGYILFICDTAFPPSPQNGAAIDASGTGDIHGNGFLAGIQGGYNWQIDNYVYGLESDFGAFRLRGSRTGVGVYPQFFFVSAGDQYAITNSFSTNWLYTLRGRFGWTTDKWWYDHDRLWLYVTGGLALTKLKTSFSFSDVEGDYGSGSKSALMPGWALGAGLEYMMNQQWSLNVEYLHLDFGNVCASGIIVGGGGYAQGISTCANLNADLVRFGINYKL